MPGAKNELEYIFWRGFLEHTSSFSVMTAGHWSEIWGQAACCCLITYLTGSPRPICPVRVWLLSSWGRSWVHCCFWLLNVKAAVVASTWSGFIFLPFSETLPRLLFMGLEEFQLLGEPGAASGACHLYDFQVHLSLLTRRAAWQFALALYKIHSQELGKMCTHILQIKLEMSVYRE